MFKKILKSSISFFLLLEMAFLFPRPLYSNEDFLKELRKVLEGKLKEKITETLSKELINYDRQTRTISFSPMILRLTGEAAKRRMNFFSEFKVDPGDDRLSFDILLKNGTGLKIAIIPESLEIDPHTFSISGKLPGGLKISQSEDSIKSLSSFFDSFLGISEKFGNLLKNVTIEGDTFRLQRPFGVSALGRALKPECSKSALKQILPLTMEKGWLKLHVGDLSEKNRLLDLAVEMLLMKLKNQL